MLRHLLSFLRPTTHHQPTNPLAAAFQAREAGLQGAKRPLRERVASSERQRAHFYSDPSLQSLPTPRGVLDAVGIQADSDGVLFFFPLTDGD